ncbi:dioxygenase [Microbacterium halophytorum]|uniref:dioxygenase n=1 Tax=Microbacterium halophytorum TaxID=2067568 RepID=UPI000CFCC3EC|nr:dioxygenase [Microbacterium halophytorum]
MAQSRSKAQREERERAQRYEARRRLNDERQARRRRDNVLASIVGGGVVVLAIAAQAVFYEAGPGAGPEPTPLQTSDLPDTPVPEDPNPLPLDDEG